MIIRLLSIVLCIFILCPAIVFSTSNLEFRTHGCLFLDNNGSGTGIDLDLSFGLLWRFLMARAILHWEYEEPAHLADLQFAVSGIFSSGRHSLFAGLQAGKRIFRMGYSWKRWLYGFHAGYELRISRIFSLGAEYRFNLIEGSSQHDNTVVLLPAFRF